MRLLRQIHLYLGCLFAPMLIYFAMSGAWQVFRFNDIPKDGAPSQVRVVLHALSSPHTSSTFPGDSPKTEKSAAFSVFALLSALGLATTTFLGIALAVRFGKNRALVYLALGTGVLVPVILLLIR